MMAAFRNVRKYISKFFYHILALFGINYEFGWVNKSGDVCATMQCEKTATMIISNMNKGVNPCVNFYEYACGNFRKHHPLLPYDNYVSPYSLRIDEINEKCLVFLQKTNLDAYPNIQKIFKIYQQCLNEKTINGLEVINDGLKSVGLPTVPPFHIGTTEHYDFSSHLARIHRYSPLTSFLFHVAVRQDPKDPSRNRIFFGEIPKMSGAPIIYDDSGETRKGTTSTEIRTSLIQHIERTVRYFYNELGVQLTEDGIRRIKNRIIGVSDFFIELDKATNVDKFKTINDVSYTTTFNLQSWTNAILKGGDIQINWYAYFEVLFSNIADRRNTEINSDTIIMLLSHEQIHNALAVLRQTNIDIFVCAMWFTVVQSYHYFAPPALQDSKSKYHVDVFKTAYVPHSVKKKRACLALLSSNFSNLAGYVLATTENGPQNKEKIIDMIKNLKKNLKEIINNTSWLDAETRIRAIEKLQSVTSEVSFSDIHLNLGAIEASYATLFIGSNFYTTMITTLRAQINGKLESLFSRNIFDLKINVRPAAVTASYYQEYVHMTIPIGILGFPFYDLGLEVLNFAAIGSQIGHELGHAFDMKGRCYNQRGEFQYWWSQKSTQHYEIQAKCFQELYSSFYFKEIGKNVNGYFTLSENIADAIGFKVALKTYRNYVIANGKEKKLKGLENLTHEKLFTLAFANIWCENSSNRHLKETIEGDEHAPASVRVNGIMMNSKDFEDIWNCSGVNTKNHNPNKCEILS